MNSIWRGFARDPRDPQYADMRASDADRDRVREVVAEAFADGRLDLSEFDERCEAITQAKTLGSLPPILSDLVPSAGLVPSAEGSLDEALTGPALRAEAESRYTRARHQAMMAFLWPSVICWSVWALVLLGGEGTPFPWPLFVTLGTAWHWSRLATSREQSIRDFERQIHKEQRRELGRAHGERPDERS